MEKKTVVKGFNTPLQTRPAKFVRYYHNFVGTDKWFMYLTYILDCKNGKQFVSFKWEIVTTKLVKASF